MGKRDDDQALTDKLARMTRAVRAGDDEALADEAADLPKDGHGLYERE